MKFQTLVYKAAFDLIGFDDERSQRNRDPHIPLLVSSSAIFNSSFIANILGQSCNPYVSDRQLELFMTSSTFQFTQTLHLTCVMNESRMRGQVLCHLAKDTRYGVRSLTHLFLDLDTRDYASLCRIVECFEGLETLCVAFASLIYQQLNRETSRDTFIAEQFLPLVVAKRLHRLTSLHLLRVYPHASLPSALAMVGSNCRYFEEIIVDNSVCSYSTADWYASCFSKTVRRNATTATAAPIFPNLRRLKLYEHQLQTAKDTSYLKILASLPRLERLNLNVSRVRIDDDDDTITTDVDLEAAVEKMHYLSEIELDSLSQITDRSLIAIAVASPVTLRRIKLRNLPLVTGSCIEHFDFATEIDLDFAGVDDENFVSFKGLEHLNSLTFAEALSSNLAASLRSVTSSQLTNLYIESCQHVDDETMRAVCHISTLTSLKILFFNKSIGGRSVNISCDSYKLLGTLPRLTTLDLSVLPLFFDTDDGIKDDDVQAFLESRKLTCPGLAFDQLRISSHGITGKVFDLLVDNNTLLNNLRLFIRTHIFVESVERYLDSNSSRGSFVFLGVKSNASVKKQLLERKEKYRNLSILMHDDF